MVGDIDRNDVVASFLPAIGPLIGETQAALLALKLVVHHQHTFVLFKLQRRLLPSHKSSQPSIRLFQVLYIFRNFVLLMDVLIINPSTTLLVGQLIVSEMGL